MKGLASHVLQLSGLEYHKVSYLIVKTGYKYYTKLRQTVHKPVKLKAQGSEFAGLKNYLLEYIYSSSAKVHLTVSLHSSERTISMH